MSITRRRFLGSMALAGMAGSEIACKALSGSADGKSAMPMRVLGKTGARVSLLGFGCGSRWLMYEEEEKAGEALHRALDAGVNYVDTAFNYGAGKSEQRLGRFLKGRRKDVWLATKIGDRKYDDVLRVVDGCLKRLQTDHVDLLHMHSLGNAADLAAIEAPGGALKAMYRLREQKVARCIGVTCHTDPEVLKTCLERHDLDCTQMALNAALMGAASPSRVRGYPKSFEKIALPVALKKKMGVTAMKVFAQELLLPDGAPEDLVRYAMSLPVASAVIGMPKLEYIDRNVHLARTFTPMPKEEQQKLTTRLAALKKTTLDAHFLRHEDVCDAHGVAPV